LTRGDGIKKLNLTAPIRFMNPYCPHGSLRHLFAILIALFAGCGFGRADDVIINQFNDASGIAGWRFDYGGASHTIEFSPSQDAINFPLSGSMKVTLGFDAALNATGNNKGAVTLDLSSPLDASAYLTMEMDVKIETGSAADSGGNSGYFQMVIRNTSSYAFNSQFGTGVSTNNGWRHISVPVTGGRDDIRALTLELYGGANLTGPVTFYVDNVKFTKPSSITDIFVSRFDTASARTGWRFDYGGVTNAIVFDAAEDATNNPASGSLKVTFGFNPALFGNNGGAITLDLPSPLAGSDFLSMEMDVKVANGSAVDASESSGYLQLVIRNGATYEFYAQVGTPVRTNDGWRHLVSSPLTGEFGDIRAITIELAGSETLNGPVTFYIDNLKFTKTSGPPPGPTLGMERPIRGLNLIPTSGQYQRQNIASVNNSGLGWIGVADPVTYAVTIHKYPDGSHSGFQTHLFLVPGTPGTDNSPDYTQPAIVFLDIQSRGDGTAAAAFRYKVNEPNGNSFLYGAGTLGVVTNSTPVGTWSVTFTQDTNATVTSPGGATGTFALPPAAAALFADPLAVYVGAQPNAGGNVGQTLVLGRFRLTRGATAVIDDNFLEDTDLDPATWQIAAGNAAGVRLVGPDAAFWLNWTSPDTGFALQTTTTAADPNSWLFTGLAATQMGPLKRILIHKFTGTPDPDKVYEPDAGQSYFRLLKP
jgi:hypothetical protein